MTRQRKKNKRGHTPLSSYIKQHPERLAVQLGPLAFLHPSTSSGTLTLDTLELRDLESGALTEHAEEPGRRFRCPTCKHSYIIPDDVLNDLIDENLKLHRSFFGYCAHCSRRDPIIVIGGHPPMFLTWLV